MTSTLLIVQIILSIAITISVLLQKSSSIGLGAYSGSNESMFGAKGPMGFLAKLTFTLAILFVLNTLALGYLYTKNNNKSVVDTVTSVVPVSPEKATPVAPAAPTTQVSDTAPSAPVAPTTATAEEKNRTVSPQAPALSSEENTTTTSEAPQAETNETVAPVVTNEENITASQSNTTLK